VTPPVVIELDRHEQRDLDKALRELAEELDKAAGVDSSGPGSGGDKPAPVVTDPPTTNSGTGSLPSYS
jgi:hypothetical protein